jgi:hypothetical protein
MLEQDDDVDWILALDTDMVVTGDLSDLLTDPSVRARVVDTDPLTGREWRRLFGHFGMKRPPKRLRTTSTGKATTRYFNSGAVFVPQRHVVALAAAWRGFVPAVLSALESLGSISDHSFFTDQFALALALASTELPVDPLPIDVNTPSHLPIHPRWRPSSIAPRLVHYHHEVDHAGRVLESGYPLIDTQIARANTAWLRMTSGVR